MQQKANLSDLEGGRDSRVSGERKIRIFLKDFFWGLIEFTKNLLGSLEVFLSHTKNFLSLRLESSLVSSL